MKFETATLAGGCFWCTEAIFNRIKGVEKVIPGYAGGDIKNPTYTHVSEGTTGHAEAIQITYDPHLVGYEKLLEIFFKTHDPTTYDRQGADTGPQYRSIIFYHTREQKELAENIKKSLDGAHVFSGPIVTEIKPFKNFYEAEDYHKNYFEKHKNNPYCSIVINPKIEHLTQQFSENLK